jgi:hypothetical protein
MTRKHDEPGDVVPALSFLQLITLLGLCCVACTAAARAAGLAWILSLAVGYVAGTLCALVLAGILVTLLGRMAARRMPTAQAWIADALADRGAQVVPVPAATLDGIAGDLAGAPRKAAGARAGG